MFKYRVVGDKIRIKNRKWYNSLKDEFGNISNKIVDFGFNIDMAKFCGKIGIITDAINTTYRNKKIVKYFLDIDDEYWQWSEGMFESNNNILEIE